MTNFKVGDKVRLTGEFWDRPEHPQSGDIVVVSGVNLDGDAFFRREDHFGYKEMWYIVEPHWSAELVEATAPEEDAESPNPEAVVPDHYQFGPVRVHQISGYLTAFSAQALQYIARSSRIDGNNKGDAREDLLKAQRFINLELERLSDQDN